MLDDYESLGREALELCRQNYTCRGNIENDDNILNFMLDQVYEQHPDFNASQIDKKQQEVIKNFKEFPNTYKILGFYFPNYVM